MSGTAGRIGWLLFALTCALQIAAVGLSLGRELSYETLLYGLVAVLMAGAGALIVARHDRHPVGWLFCLFGLYGAFGELAQGWGLRDLPGGDWGTWFSLWMWIVHGVVFAFVFALFPDGRFLSSRWRAGPWLTAIGCLVALPGLALGPPSDSAFAPGSNPIAIDTPLADALAGVGQALFVIGFVLSGVSLVVRLRCSEGVERQQLKWFAYATAMLIAIAPFVVALWSRTIVVQVLFPVVLCGLPIAAGIAILRYRLYEIDRVVNRTLVYGALTAAIVGLYAAFVLAVDALLADADSRAGALVATGVVAVAVHPLRLWLQRRVNRLMYGDRDDPYAALSRLGQRLGADIAPDAVLTTIISTVAEALRVPYVAIELAHGAGFQAAAVHGARGLGEVERVPLVSRGDTVGELVVESRAAGESLRSDELRLLADLARQAATAVDAARLTNDLQRSRERLVVAREEERRRLRRDLHDGLGPTLAAVVLQLDNARALVREDPEVSSAMLAALRDAAQEAIGDLRRLVYGLRPPALDELGLVPAIREQAARMNGDDCGGVRIRVEGPDELAELPAAVEVAAFRIAVEAITNVVRHADANACVVQLALNGNLEVDVHDDGTAHDGYAAGVGISSMRERATELGGSFTITRASERGTRVHVTLPLSGS